jgi:hypothetical protein
MSSCFGAVSAAMEPVDVPCKLASEAETQAFGAATFDSRQGGRGWGYRHVLVALLVLLLASLVFPKL